MNLPIVFSNENSFILNNGSIDVNDMTLILLSPNFKTLSDGNFEIKS